MSSWAASPDTPETRPTRSSPGATENCSAAEIDRDVNAALKVLYDSEPGTEALAGKAKGILVFSSIVKGGFLVGAQYGEGALRKGGKTPQAKETKPLEAVR